MNIALLGYGKMGKEIEKIAVSRNHKVSLIIDIDNKDELTVENLKKVDVAIDFSVPTSAYDNIKLCFEADTPIVCGTTGWIDKYDEIMEISNKQGKGFFYTSNYSIGVNVLFQMNKQLAKIMNSYSEYEVDIEETHHTQKLDAPSGTAITLAEDLIANIERKSAWELDKQSADDKLKITAIRRENVPGIHVVTYDSDIDTIQLSHSAKSRRGFAMGAVIAAEFMKGKKAPYEMKDILGF